MSRDRIGFWTLWALGLDCCIGLGVYVLPGKILSQVGLWVFVLLGVVATMLLVIAAVLATLAEGTTQNGGPQVYVTQAFGPRLGCLVGWMDWVGTLLGLSGMAELLGQSLGQRWLPISLLALLGCINLAGLRFSGRTLVIMTGTKVAPLVAIAIMALVSLPTVPDGKSTWDLLQLPALPSLDAWKAATLGLMFMCVGFENISIPAGEAHNGPRTVPRATLAALGSTTLLYALIFLGLCRHQIAAAEMPLVHLWTSSRAADATHWIYWFMGMSILGLLAARALVAPRALLPLAEEGFLPGWLAWRTPLKRVPVPAILASTFAAMLLLAIAGIGDVVDLTTAGLATQYTLCSLALARLASHGKVRRPHSRVLAAAGLGVSAIFCISVPLEAWLGLGLILVSGLVLSTLAGRRPFYVENEDRSRPSIDADVV